MAENQTRFDLTAEPPVDVVATGETVRSTWDMPRPDTKAE